MRVRVTKGFTDKTRIGNSNAFRKKGLEFECSKERCKELEELGYVEAVNFSKESEKVFSKASNEKE